MNEAWHRQHVLPKNANVGERLVWHKEHQKACGCRPIPAKLMALMPRTSSSLLTKTKPTTKPKPKPKPKPTATRPKRSPISEAAEVDPRFVPVVGAFANDRQVTYGGKGFGSSGLKVGGKLFAMISSKGKFVAKLPKERVDELVRTGQGEYFDPGHGRLMKEWVALDGAADSWIGIAKEAHRFVRGGKV